MYPSSKVSYLRARVLGCGLAAAAIISIVGASIAPVSASADPVSDQKAQATALAEKINAQVRQVEILAEQFNGAQLHQTQVEEQLADARVRFANAQAQAEQFRMALNHEAVTAYVHGGLVSHPTMTGYQGAADIAVAKGYFNVVTSNQVDALDRMRLAEQELRQQQAVLLTAQRDSQQAVSQVASRRQAVEQANNAATATLNQVQGDLATLVAEQQAAIAAQQQAQAKAAFDAAQARQQRLQAATAAVAPTRSAPAQSAGTPSAGAIVSGILPPTTIRPTTPTTGSALPPVKASGGAAAAVAYAQAQLGKPYLWAGAGPSSFDCSGLTMRAWGAAGVSLPHSAAGQYANTAHVAIADLQPGDLVFFGSDIGHVGIYVGGGSMIHAPHSGAVVSYSTIFWPDLRPYGGRP